MLISLPPAKMILRTVSPASHLRTNGLASAAARRLFADVGPDFDLVSQLPVHLNDQGDRLRFCQIGIVGGPGLQVDAILRNKLLVAVALLPELLGDVRCFRRQHQQQRVDRFIPRERPVYSRLSRLH